LVGEKLEQYAAPAKIIVYGGTIERTQELSRVLDCQQYYREVGDREEKGAVMGRWQRGDGRLIVATNAFGLGIDAPDVRVVIHAGDIYQMRSYSQESGRGGRDGERSEAIVVMPAGKQEELRNKIARAKARTQPWKIQSRVMRPWETKQVEWEKMERFLSGSKCRRIYLDSEMDDRQNRKRCEVGEERCDVCEKDDAMVEAEEARQAAYVEEQRAIREQAAQTERERQGRWFDVPSSSIGIPAPSGEVLVPGSAIVASPKPFTDQNPTPSEEEGHSITRSRCSSISFDKGFAADQGLVGESRAFEAQKHQRSQQRLRIEAESQQEGHEVWNLEARLDSWVGKCPMLRPAVSRLGG
jgi:superfamily II DNA/RNA helicase